MTIIQKGERMSDLISRQTAMDFVGSMEMCDEISEEAYKKLMNYLEELPSAQPEIIRCKDCKHWDGVDTCDVIDAPVWDNDFCSMAERRTDEE